MQSSAPQTNGNAASYTVRMCSLPHSCESSEASVNLRRRLEMDGVITVKMDEFQSFPALAFLIGGSVAVRIPIDICRALGIKRGTLLQVAVRRVSVDYCMKEYGFVPKPLKKKPRIVCPKCGKPGYLYVSPSGRTFIGHSKCDGFTEKTRCYLGKSKRGDGANDE